MNIPPFNSLRTKMLLALALGMVLLFALIFIVARTELLKGYSKLEKDKTLIQVNSAISLLNEQPDQLSSVVRDYAHWDDLYQYMAKPTPAFIESSFADSIFANLKINAFFIIDSEGKALYKKAIDYSSEKPWHIPKMLEQAVSKGGALINPSVSSRSGFFWTPEGICIVSAFDILDTSAKKPRRGTLIMVRLLNKPLLQHIEKILNVNLAVEVLRKVKDNTVSRSLIRDGTAVVTLNNNQVAGFGLINTVGSNTKLVLNTVSDRKIFAQGQSSLMFLYKTSLLLAFLLAGFSWLLDKLVLARLEHLNENVSRIGESATTSGRVEELSGGNDEMVSLAHGINGMLERLDESQHALQFEKERAQVTLTSIADAVITSNVDGCIIYMNTAAERLTGINLNRASGQALKNLFHLMAEDKATAIDSSWLTDTTSTLDEVLLHRADGQQFIISKSASQLHDFNGVLFGTVTVLHDVTMLRALSNQLSYQARYDSLTGLANRYEFDCKAKAAIEDALTSDRVHCLAYIDLDKFKLVNDSCGHMAGDLFLKQLADHLKTKLRSADTLARLGGDEFALMLMGCSLLKAQEIVEDVLQTVQAYRFTYEGKVFKVGASIGLTEISAQQSLNLSELLATVDSACYAAKRDGGNRVNVHLAIDDDMKEYNSQLEWVSRINSGLENNRFVLYFQALQGSHAGAETHCELLVRMYDNTGTLYPPGAFLPSAERYHLMPQIDRWVLNEALSIIARKGEHATGVYAINLSGQSLSQEGFLEHTIQKIVEHQVNTRHICFEITETAIITNLDKARQFMIALRAIGCRFSLDDFGSSLSSFAYLKHLEVDFLKIDGLFVKSIANNKIDRAMVESINNVGHVMGLQTIAEFAENDAIIKILKEIGVDYVQGYGVAMPKLFK